MLETHWTRPCVCDGLAMVSNSVSGIQQIVRLFLFTVAFILGSIYVLETRILQSFCHSIKFIQSKKVSSTHYYFLERLEETNAAELRFCFYKK